MGFPHLSFMRPNIYALCQIVKRYLRQWMKQVYLNFLGELDQDALERR